MTKACFISLSPEEQQAEIAVAISAYAGITVNVACVDPTDVGEAGWAVLNAFQTLLANNSLKASASLNFGSLATLVGAELTIAVTGAVVGDFVTLGLPAAPEAGLLYNARVSAANVVTVRCQNVSAGTIDPASATFHVKVTPQ